MYAVQFRLHPVAELLVSDGIGPEGLLLFLGKAVVESIRAPLHELLCSERSSDPGRSTHVVVDMLSVRLKVRDLTRDRGRLVVLSTQARGASRSEWLKIPARVIEVSDSLENPHYTSQALQSR